MDRRVEILVEERSMQVFLNGLLPRVLPNGYTLGGNCFVYAHEGKSDLQKRLPNRIKAYLNYPEQVHLIIIHDQDSSDCVELKRRIERLIQQEDSSIRYLVRIACRELENWYLGDLGSVERLYPSSRASRLNPKSRKYRDVDKLTGSQEMKLLSREFSKTACATAMGEIIDIENNQSNSFRQLISGLDKILK